MKSSPNAIGKTNYESKMLSELDSLKTEIIVLLVENEAKEIELKVINNENKILLDRVDQLEEKTAKKTEEVLKPELFLKVSLVTWVIYMFLVHHSHVRVVRKYSIAKRNYECIHDICIFQS